MQFISFQPDKLEAQLAAASNHAHVSATPKSQWHTAPPTAPQTPHSKSQYVELLRSGKLRERARTAREAMAARFPLTPEQWLAWVNDELDALRSAEDLGRVKGLYKRAVRDYLSVDLWVSYLE